MTAPELLALLRGEVASTRAPDNRPMVDATAPLAGHHARLACSHDGAVVFLTVEGHGLLCGDCWRRWVRGAPRLARPGRGARAGAGMRTRWKLALIDSGAVRVISFCVG